MSPHKKAKRVQNEESKNQQDRLNSDLEELEILDIRIPKWDADDLVERSCAICNSELLRAVFCRPDGLYVRPCKNCGCFTVSPSPSSDQLNKFYSNYHETHFTHELSRAKHIRVEASTICPTHDPRIAWLSSHFALNGAYVLDVGCGKGQFLFQLSRLGARTYGVEFDRSAAEVALQLGAAMVHVGTIADMTGSMSFDLIVLNDIIEHPLDPKILLDQCIERLSPGGIILIWTPNGGDIRTSASPVCLRVDLEHMQYLTDDTIFYLATECGLKIRHLETTGIPALGGMSLTAEERRVKSRIKRIPGVIYLMTIFRTLRRSFNCSEDAGSYHLFACLQKE